MATTQTAPKKKGLINFDFLQKLGKVLMTVIAVMPAAGLMISLGKLVQMSGGDIAAVMTIGTTMENIGWAVINNLHILFAVAIGGTLLQCIDYRDRKALWNNSFRHFSFLLFFLVSELLHHRILPLTENNHCL